MPITPIQATGTLPPAGHYSQAVVHNGLVYLSGQLPIDLATGRRCTGSIEEQTEQVLQNVRLVLEAAGSSLDRLLKVTVYVADVEYWSAVNAVYARVLGDHRPARAVVPTGPLHHGFLIEVEAIAATVGSCRPPQPRVGNLG
ncbi:MAG: Rid family detoxifying hydrolase [Gemmatimonadota bacterium]|nr:Rid family detoxifying hydrolase [Gemmatimonadota bacterium]